MITFLIALLVRHTKRALRKDFKITHGRSPLYYEKMIQKDWYKEIQNEGLSFVDYFIISFFPFQVSCSLLSKMKKSLERKKKVR